MAKGYAMAMATREGGYIALMEQYEAIARQAEAGLLAEARYLFSELEAEVVCLFPNSPLHQRIQTMLQTLKAAGRAPDRWSRQRRIWLQVGGRAGCGAPAIRIADLNPPLQPKELVDFLQALSLLQNVCDEMLGQARHFIDARCEADNTTLWLELYGASLAAQLAVERLAEWQNQHTTEISACASSDAPQVQAIRRRWADRLIAGVAPGLPENLHTAFVERLQPALSKFQFSRLTPIQYRETCAYH